MKSNNTAADSTPAAENNKGEEPGIYSSIAGAAAAGAGIVGATVASITGNNETKEDEKRAAAPQANTVTTTTTTTGTYPPVNSTIYTTGEPSVIESRHGQVVTESLPIGHARVDDVDAPLRPAPAISTDYTALLRQTGPVESTSTYLQPVTATNSTAPAVSNAAPAFAGGALGATGAAGAAGATNVAAPTYASELDTAQAPVDDDTHEPWSVEWPANASKSQTQYTRPEALATIEQGKFGESAWSCKEGRAEAVKQPSPLKGFVGGFSTGAGATGTGAAGIGIGTGTGVAGAADKPQGAVTGATGELKDKATGAPGDVKDKATGAAGYAKDKAAGAPGDVKDKAAGAAGDAKDKATGAAGDAKDKVAGAAGDANGKAEGATKKLGLFGKIKKAFKK